MNEVNAFNYISRPYSIENLIKMMVNDKEFSDVSFLVGNEKQLIRANKSILRLGSPVFEKMFYGELREKSNHLIEIPDITPAGFLNMLSYIYGHSIDIPVSEIYETYVAGDKYLVCHFTDALSEFIKKKLTTSNCYLINAQLLKIGDDNHSSLNVVRKFIRENCKEIIKSNSFVHLKENLLVDLLEMESLNVGEIDLLRATSRWVDAQVLKLGLDATVENKQKVFEPFKHLIRFSDLNPDEVTKSEDLIRNLLTDRDISSLFFHLFNKSKPLSIIYQNSRASKNEYNRVFNVSTVSSVQKLLDYSISQLATYIKVNQIVHIKSILTVPFQHEIKLNIYKNDRLLDATYVRSRQGQLWRFEFHRSVEIKLTDNYWFHFLFESSADANLEVCDYTLSDQFDLELCDRGNVITFKLLPNPQFLFHCIDQINFQLCPDLPDPPALTELKSRPDRTLRPRRTARRDRTARPDLVAHPGLHVQ